MNVLSIASSDPSSGAGIQGDLKTFSALGAYGLTVVTAITSQNSSKFFKIEPVSDTILKSQLRSVLSDFKIDAVKIGMVYDRKTIQTISSELKGFRNPIVIDPVFSSTTGGTLLRDDAFSDFKRLLVPLSYVITPNILEVERIVNVKIRTIKDMKLAAQKIAKMGAKNVIIKGGHMKEDPVTDLLFASKKFHTFSQKRIHWESHGGGCVFSAALSVSLAKGKDLIEAAKCAQKFSMESIKGAIRIGRGLPIASQSTNDYIQSELATAINQFIIVDGIASFIPECQTNFVFSKPIPNSISDIIGVEGRIVKTGNSLAVAGLLKYGGSRHVASAVLEVSKKFPTIRSAINIKYSNKIIHKAISNGFRVSFYDRSSEPQVTKRLEGKTIPWGIGSALSKLKSPPDLIYHKGAMGKEPMILIFGTSPKQVLTKVMKIVR